MDGLFGKLRAFAFDSKNVGDHNLFAPADSPKACFLCDSDLGSSYQGWVQCSICGYVFCRRCCSARGKEGSTTPTTPACDFCKMIFVVVFL